MNSILNDTAFSSGSSTAAVVAIVGIGISALGLILLHILSPEFLPSWRLVSEYANGHYSWILTVVFLGWAIGSAGLFYALLPLGAGTLGKIGLFFLLLATIGQVMGGLFDINHSLHGPAAMIGIPSLCIAAVVLTIAMDRMAGITAPAAWTAHLPWISFALMIGALFVFFSALKSAGVEMTGEPLKELPLGVYGYVGWANRLLFAASYLWVVLASLSVIRASV